MSRSRATLTPSRVPILAGFGLVLAVTVAALLSAAGSDRRATAFSVDVPASAPVASLAPGQRACQGPVPVSAPVRGLTVWLKRQTGPGVAVIATLRRPGSGRPLATASLTPSRGQPVGDIPAVSGRLDRAVTGGSVTVCLRSTGHRAAQLMGATATEVSGSLLGGGPSARHAALALLFTTPRPPTLLAMVPTIFRRAALFHPAWMGAWTFWVLVAALVGAAGLIATSLVRAASLDAADLEDRA